MNAENNGGLYNVRMRASRNDGDGSNVHVSGAERIVGASDVPAAAAALAKRALRHSRGGADAIRIKAEKLDAAEVMELDALPVSTIAAASPEEARRSILELLNRAGASRPEDVADLLSTVAGMRGAMLVDDETLERPDPDEQRGVRATCMDAAPDGEPEGFGRKNHFREALVLATKVAHAPGIIAEVCISDDPDYTTGYVASKTLGYVRLTNIKKSGVPAGGRVVIYRGGRQDVPETVRFLESRPVLVRGVPRHPTAPASESPTARMERELEALEAASLKRHAMDIEAVSGGHVVIHGRKALSLASNSYLGLHDDPDVKAAAARAAMEFGTGASGSRLLSGGLGIHQRLERLLAEFKGQEAALLFGTGYMANVGAITALCGRESVVFSDELNHASIIDGCRLSGAEIVIYRHNDMGDLEEKAARHCGRHGLVVSDSDFSMDGDIANVPELAAIAARHGFLSMVDDAHALGVIGKTGRGSSEHFGAAARKPDVTIGTLSKAVGCEGGFACGSRVIVDYLRNKARSFIFSTAPSPAVVGAALRAVEKMRDEPARVEALRRNIDVFVEALSRHGIPAATQTAIVPIRIGESAAALRVAERLLARGYYVPAIRHPSVPQGTARLRASVMAVHTPEALAAAAAAIAACLQEA